jgi:multidrug efflux pump subunit AcrB
VLKILMFRLEEEVLQVKTLILIYTAPSPYKLKQASLELQATLDTFPGVYSVADNLPFGKPQIIFDLTLQASILGLTTQALGEQLRAAFDGYLVQIINRGEDAIDIRLKLPKHERNDLNSLNYLPIKLPSSELVPLASVANFQIKPGLDTLRHVDSKLMVNVSAQVNASENNANTIINQLTPSLNSLISKYNINYELKGAN